MTPGLFPLFRAIAGIAGCLLGVLYSTGAQAQQCRFGHSVFAASLAGVGLGVLTTALVTQAASDAGASAQELSKGGFYGATAGASLGLLGYALDLPLCQEKLVEARLAENRPDLDSGLQPLSPIIEWARQELPRGFGGEDRVVYDSDRVSLGVNVSYLF